MAAQQCRESKCLHGIICCYIGFAFFSPCKFQTGNPSRRCALQGGLGPALQYVITPSWHAPRTNLDYRAASPKAVRQRSLHYKINRRPSQSKKNSARSQAQIKRREHEKSSVRAKVEHVFAVVKLQLRFRKTRYRGLQKQIAKMNIMFALANLILADRPCLEA